MIDRKEIEETASLIRLEMEEDTPPICPLRIAQEEGILLAPGHYGEAFDGRVEYHRKQSKFILFYPELNSAHNPARVRFSVAHELGHYYLPKHRDLLLRGNAHYSEAGFICDNRLEREADFFAAALLLPEKVLYRRISKGSFLTLKDILALASAWKTSVTCAAIRYVEYTPEACAILLSRKRQILYYVPSEEAACQGFKCLGRKQVPDQTVTAQASEHQPFGSVVEHSSHTDMWFSQRRSHRKIWEEAFPLGYTGIVLTMFVFEEDEEDSD